MGHRGGAGQWLGRPAADQVLRRWHLRHMDSHGEQSGRLLSPGQGQFDCWRHPGPADHPDVHRHRRVVDVVSGAAVGLWFYDHGVRLRLGGAAGRGRCRSCHLLDGPELLLDVWRGWSKASAMPGMGHHLPRSRQDQYCTGLCGTKFRFYRSCVLLSVARGCARAADQPADLFRTVHQRQLVQGWVQCDQHCWPGR